LRKENDQSLSAKSKSLLSCAVFTVRRARLIGALRAVTDKAVAIRGRGLLTTKWLPTGKNGGVAVAVLLIRGTTKIVINAARYNLT